MREKRTELLKVLLTPTEKEQIRAYAEKYDLTMSEAVRELCYKIFNKEREE